MCIDAMRGAAALAVVFFHAFDGVAFDKGAQYPNSVTSAITFAFSFGFAGVWLFFVISGFCIHLRWVRNAVEGREPKVAFVDFWKRRAWRLYPPYLVALTIYILVSFARGDISFTRFFWYDLTTHLFMVHNLDARTVFSLNGVFWTLAIEEQLYLMYFLLLAMRSRLGWWRTLGICLAVRVAWFAVCFLLWRWKAIQLPVGESALAYWFVWALGAVSVEAAFGLLKLPSWALQMRSSALLCCLLQRR